MAGTTEVEILLIEDNPGDTDLVLEALSNNKVKNKVHTVDDGEKALDFLYKRGAYIDAPTPDLVFLDLNLPKVSGKEILQDIKANENLRDIPVVVLSSSQADKDVAQSYNLRANAYVVKPVDLNQFLTVVQEIEHFWIDIVKLPSNKGS